MTSIYILIENITSNLEIYIDISKKIITINNKEKQITIEKIDDLIRIIRTWNNEYINPKIIDAESFLIKINTDEGIEIIKGHGDYPNNYNLLKEWISDLYE